MISQRRARGVQACVLVGALSLYFACGAHAQSTSGSIFGEANAGSTVSMESQATGIRRSVIADADGSFTFNALPPGQYEVSSSGNRHTVQVNLGGGTLVDFTRLPTTELAAVTVIGSGVINPIDVSSVESTTIFTAQQIQELPVLRDITNVALLAPGTVRGDTGFGNLASFGGASVAENGYYINGLDVTNIRNLTSYATLPFSAIAEQQIKTGGYGAEFGRSLGGVINLVTKRGSNSWQAGAEVYWTPWTLREDGTDVLSNDPGDDFEQRYFVYRSGNQLTRFNFNVYAGGPLIENNLFLFVMLEGRDNSTDLYKRSTSQHREGNDPSGMLKLDWNISDNHILEFTGIYNKTKLDYIDYQNPNEIYYANDHYEESAIRQLEHGGHVLIGKYTGYFGDDFTFSAQAGRVDIANNFFTPVSLPGAECPRIIDSRDDPNGLHHLGCWNVAQPVVRDASFKGAEKDIRTAYRADADWHIGDHSVGFGIDAETFESSHAGFTFSGGVYYRYWRTEDIFGPEAVVDIGPLVVREQIGNTESGRYEAVNRAAYVEDSWQVNDNWLLYGGLRAETFDNKNAVGESFVKSGTLLAPRLGFSFDVYGDSAFKIYGTAGRYFIPVATNTNIRASSGFYRATTWYALEAINPMTFEPELGAVVIPTAINGSLRPPDPRTLAATNLEPMYQDEFILGFQHRLGRDWSIGVRAIGRELKAGMDDVCSHNAFNQWAAESGYDEDFAVDGDGIDMPDCYMMNPGRSVSMALDPDNDGDVEVFTVPAEYFGLPEYERTYQAVELLLEKVRSDGWYMQGSYTWSRSEGNAEGYVHSGLEQDYAGITQDFDYPAFAHGAHGYLPNDRRHTLKLFGARDLTDEWLLSVNLLVQSGRPVNCYGFVPAAALGIPEPDGSIVAMYAASSFYCLDPSGALVDDRGTPETSDDVHYTLGQRGDHGRTPWTRSLDLGVAYTPGWADEKLTLQMTVFNIFNAQEVTEYNEFSQITSASQSTDPNFLNDQNYQTPRAVRFTARYDFL